MVATPPHGDEVASDARTRAEERAAAQEAAEPEGAERRLKGWSYRRLDREAEVTDEQAARIDEAARDRAIQWLAGNQLPESVQRRIRPLLINRKAA